LPAFWRVTSHCLCGRRHWNYTPDGSFCLARPSSDDREYSLDTKEYVRGKLDGRELTASEAVTIIWFDISQFHA